MDFVPICASLMTPLRYCRSSEGLVDGLDLVVREVCADDGARLAGVNGRHGAKACEQAHGKYNGQGPFEKFHGVGFLSPRSMGCGALQDETLPL